MAEVFEINQKRIFSLEEARALLPIVRRITKATHDEVNRLAVMLKMLPAGEKQEALEIEIKALFRDWLIKMKKLGVEAKGSWLVDFDNGEGYYCWRYPEPEISHFHGYQDGFSKRVKIH